MVTYIARRLMLAVLTCMFISVATFAIIHLPPGDYVSSYVAQMAASGSSMTQEEADVLRHQYGLDQPLAVQYLKWISLAIQGNFGMSMEWHRSVYDLIGDRLLLTMVVSAAAVLTTWVLALPIGIYTAVRQHSISDYVFTLLGFIGLAVPGFLIALVLMYIGFRYFGATVGGLFSPEYAEAPWSWGRVRDLAWHLPLPALILGLGSTAQVMRVMRANLLDELRKPYLITALARGMPLWRAILKYPVRVALNPFISTIGYILPYVVSGSVIVSLVLGLPTVGPVLYKSLVAQDLFLAGSIVLMLGILTVVGTLLSDLLLIAIDPRIRLGSSR
ncbi:MAG: peptide/nickel transport system permease protein [Acetobacteraceae bacterium]|jgi:peptide/nickel transport system permease protein|nr:peptide/nickel transport system permease protein [Acetobacteraceae bacterium]